MKRLFLVFYLFLAMSVSFRSVAQNSSDMKVIYFMDPLCGWCYGFGPVLEKLKETYPQWTLDVVAGGMVPGDRARPIGEMKDYLLQAMPRVEQMTGARFSQAYRDNILMPGTAVLSSDMPCRVQVWYKHRGDALRLSDFAHDIQKLLYVEGLNLNDIESYRDLAAVYDFDFDALQAAIDSPWLMELTQEDYRSSQMFGITGFPALVVQKGEQYFLAARGYTSWENLHATLLSIQKSE